MTPALKAAAAIATYHGKTHPMYVEIYERMIREAYAEREAAVAELVKQSRLAATRLMRAYLDVRELNEAIGAVEGTK